MRHLLRCVDEQINKNIDSVIRQILMQKSMQISGATRNNMFCKTHLQITYKIKMNISIILVNF